MLFFNLRFNMGRCCRELCSAASSSAECPSASFDRLTGAPCCSVVPIAPLLELRPPTPIANHTKKDCIENRYSLHSKIEIFMCRHRIVPSGVGFWPVIRCQLTSRKRNLLNFDFCASFFQLRFDGFCFVLGNFLFDSLRGFINQSLSFLQA